METIHVDPWLGRFMLLVAGASVVAWIVILNRPRQLLPYEPRRPVPWGWAATLLALFFVVMALGQALFGSPVEDAASKASISEHVSQLVFHIVFQIAVVGGALVAVIALSNASRSDIGLPASAIVASKDVGIGIVAWLAALLPVYGLQAMLVKALGETEGHPLIRLLEEESSVSLFVTAFVMGVLVAPIAEEFAFRLLLQGWLEKWEDARLGWRNESVADEVVHNDSVSEQAGGDENDESRMTNDELGETDSSSFVIHHSSLPAASPPSRGMFGLPYGWLPIIVSSALFALAHVGYGPDPAALFLFAIILGFIYQRSHRIVPSIVAHALFNLLSLVMLWWMLVGSAGEATP